jgi:hypothetical protein
LKRLKTFAITKMRILSHGEARGKPNRWVRLTLGIPSCTSTLCVMRLQLLRSMFRQRFELNPLWGALAGPLADGADQQLHNMLPHGKANPWMWMYWNDALCWARANGHFSFVTASGFMALAENDLFMRADFTKLCSFDSEVEQLMIPDGARVRRILTWQEDLGKIVVCNKCPWCQTIFSTVPITRTHVRRRQALGRCPDAGAWKPHTLVLPKRHNCPICDELHWPLELLHDHIIAHLCATQPSCETRDSSEIQDSSSSDSDSSSPSLP